MKVTMFMAMSVNGITARSKGEEDFLSDINWESFVKLSKKKKCIIVGRKTYDAVRKWNDFSFDDIKCKKIIVSRRNNINIGQDYIIANSPNDAVKKANNLGLREVLLVGGSKLNGSFLKEKLVDEIILNVEPVLVDKGIGLADGEFSDVELELVETKDLGGGIIQLHYEVKK
jgi:dihydrofolate reductase